MSQIDLDETTSWQVLPNGRVRAIGLAGRSRQLVLIMYISLLITPITIICLLIAPIMWLTLRKEHPFVDDHGREIINFILSSCIWILLLSISLIGIPLIFAYLILALIAVIFAMTAASRGEFHRMPMTLRFL